MGKGSRYKKFLQLYSSRIPLCLVPLNCQDRNTEAERLYARAQAIREKVLEPDDPYLAFTLDGRALSLQHMVRACQEAW